MQNNLPYIQDDIGLPILGAPYRFNDSKLAAFFLECQPDKLNSLLDTYINQPSEGKYAYRCLGKAGCALTMMIMARMTIDACNPDGEIFGKERYSELSFWIPCYDQAAWQRGEFKIALFLPFLFPDSFSAITTGREMFGFRKQLANFRYPGGDLDLWNPQFTASTVAFKELGADSVAQQYDFISMSDGSGELVRDAIWRDINAAEVGAIEQFWGSHWVCAETGSVLVPIANDFLAHCPSIFIKQFPAIEGAQAAEVRSITAAAFRLLTLRGAFPWLDLKTRSLKRFNIRFEQLASHPIVDTLGLTPASADANAQFVAASGGWLDIDFQLETGETLLNVPPRKQKIAVLGGGIGSLAAVFGITSTPGWQEKYDITLYQMGWRLGGKGASGRNQQIADRIEEHGLHIWFGYYENAFRVIRECYAEMGRPANAPLATWQQAFKPQSTILVEEYIGTRWQNWPFSFLPNNEVPGDGEAHDDHPVRFFGHLREVLDWLGQALDEHLPHADKLQAHLSTLAQWGTDKPAHHSILGDALGALERPAIAFAEYEIEAFLSAFRQRAATFPQHEQANRSMAQQLQGETVAHWQDVLEELLALVQQLLAPFAEVFEAIRRILTLAELALTVARGMLADGVLWRGYTAIDQYDFVEWLKRHGASDAVANSALVRAFYDLYLGFPNGQNIIIGDGVAIGGNTAAGELLHSYILVTLCYKGAVMWKMQAGMGDVVMTPLYQVLKQRGVRFEFFHKVSNLRLNGDKSQIGEIDIDVQATVKADCGTYNPLYDVKNLACWPANPLYEQLVQGQALQEQNIDLESSWSPWQPVAKKTLKLGADFDQVVLGISVAALPYISAELSDANPAWKTMLAQASTSQTQAMQLWLNINLEETGWPLASPILDAYGEPFNTWAAMDQTLDKENWPQNALPYGIAYFCNNMKDAQPIPPFTDYSFPASQKQRVKDSARAWLKHYTGHLWPYATQQDNKQALDWSKLVDMQNRDGEARLDGQYFRANIDPTERYVCNAANTNQYRLKAGGSGFTNLYLTGDWVDNGSLNLGCVESTVIAGLQAASALTGQSLPIAHDNIF